MTFGEKLQKLRSREGLSQDALAEILDVSRQAVSKWERDETMPETEKVIRISNYFHVTTDYLLKDAPEEDPRPLRRREFGEWFRDRGWLLGWIPLLWGIWRAAAVWTVTALQDSWWLRAWMALMYPASYAVVALAGLGWLVLCRRWRGRLRWYHAGWLAVFWGALTALRWGVVLLLVQRVPENVFGPTPEGLWSYVGVRLALAAAAAAVGLAVFFLGRRYARPAV